MSSDRSEKEKYLYVLLTGTFYEDCRTNLVMLIWKISGNSGKASALIVTGSTPMVAPSLMITEASVTGS